MDYSNFTKDMICLQNLIKNNVDNPDHSWQSEGFILLRKYFYIFPLQYGVCKDKTDKKRASYLKSPESYYNLNKDYSKVYSFIYNCDKVGIRCRESNIIVLDIDNNNAFYKFTKENNIPFEYNTFTVSTHDRNKHYYFSLMNQSDQYKNRSNKKYGFDIRVFTGYVVAPASLHPLTGKPYSIINPNMMIPAPEWLINWSFDKTTDSKSYSEIIDMKVNEESNIMKNDIQNYSNIIDSSNLSISTLHMMQNPLPVGCRSEEYFNKMVGFILNGYSKEQIYSLFKVTHLGDKLKEKDDKWFDREYENALKAASEINQKNNQSNANQIKKTKPNQTSEILNFMVNNTYYVDEYKEYYCKDASSSSIDFLNVDSDDFYAYISNLYMNINGCGISLHTFRSALSTLKYRIKSSAKRIKMITRFGEYEGNLILDLGKDDFNVVEISPNNYRIIQRPDILLNRSELILPIDDIKLNMNGLDYTYKYFSYFNLNDDIVVHLLIMTSISYLFDKISSPILYFFGESGSGKSTIARAVKSIFDITRAGHTLNSNNILELCLLLSNSGVCFIDNFTSLKQETQNNLCLSYSDGIFTKKKNYEDTKTISINLKCPLILASIDIPNLQDDFISRTEFIHIEKNNELLADFDLNDKFNQLLPYVRGELCSIASKIMPLMKNYKPLNISRHASFDLLGQAYCKIMFDNPDYYKDFVKKRKFSNSLIRIESDPILIKVLSLIIIIQQKLVYQERLIVILSYLIN